ncbi:MAG: hypothetical protein A2413_03590 [Treponema sp. RIFOXYC1_FULL_61_9]|nr:MAG: hypothetical protein A2Y36_15340 [Treponema sp. GWA1_62_8]OHE66010.1 MAG: hypothetical protein A2001_15585 [Treponema sp. GWC1_61_84]OHE73428.1 MAG: hypothetical protein A2413_03590 [Treponema sp. RIFOXYC1_FULL_61_9]
MHKRTIIISSAAALAFTLIAVGCAQTDIVAKVANSSFKAVADAAPDRISYSEEEGSWILSSAAGDKLQLAADFSRNKGEGGMADMDKPDVEFVFDAAPFLAAGLDPAKLVAPDGLIYEIEEGELMLHFELGDAAFSSEAKKSLGAVFAEIVRTQRDRIGYHEKLDHYGIKLGDGNMFEWAKDLAKNDKDIVWILNPEPFIAAGTDPAKVEGWAFAKVELKDDAGKTIFVDKLLKPFDLK